MMALDLDVIGLPGARIQEGLQPPVNSGLRLEARGRTNYASTALLWKDAVDCAGTK